jgi:hypothetical protein
LIVTNARWSYIEAGLDSPKAPHYCTWAESPVFQENRMTTTLSIEPGGTRFLVNGEPTFLLGASYYGGLGASDAFWDQDLGELQRHGFNWIRAWCTWSPYGRDVSVVDASGAVREPWMSRLEALAQWCDGAGMILDVTFSRSNGVVYGPMTGQSTHLRAARAVAEALLPFRNVYIDVGNERNFTDRRHVTYQELAELRAAVREVDPDRLVTASSAEDIPLGEVGSYLSVADVDFLTPHRHRTAESPGETAAKTREYLREAQGALGRPVPVHYQEPFRVDWRAGKWQPVAADFLADLRGAIEGGAAGWCFHNGDAQHRDDGRPRRSFDMRGEEGRMFDQLTGEERAVVESADEVCRGQ